MARDALDRYYTPDALALACMPYVARPSANRVLEPHCGGGAFVRAVRRTIPDARLTTCDIDDVPESSRGDEHVTGDFLAADLEGGYDLIIGNPPFRDPWPHVERAFALASPHGTVAFILPLARVCGRRNRLWLRGRWPSTIAPISPRPSFRGGKADMRDVAMWVWDMWDADCVARMVPLTWERDKK